MNNRVESAATRFVPVAGEEVRPLELLQPVKPTAVLCVLKATAVLSATYFVGKAVEGQHHQGGFSGDTAPARWESCPGETMSGEALLAGRMNGGPGW